MTRRVFGGALVNIGTLPPIANKALFALARVAAGAIHTVSAQRSAIVFTSLALVNVGTLEPIPNKALFTFTRDTADCVGAGGMGRAGIVIAEALVLI